MKPPRLLYLAFFYPPSRASGVYRAIATSRVFVESGWEVTVVTVDEQFLDDELGSSDRSLERLIPDGVDVERVPFTFSRHGEFPFASANAIAGHLPGLYFKRREMADRSAREDRAAFPDRYRRWIDPVVERVTGSSQRFDHILATGNPYSAFEIARLLAPTYGVGFSIDYRDPWSFDPTTAAPIQDPAVSAAESRIIGDAAHCFHVNTAIASAYAGRYPGSEHKHIVAMNGYDDESLGVVHHPRRTGPLRFGMIGTVTERWPLEALFEGWRAALPHLPQGSELILAGYLGFFQSNVGVIDSFLPRSLDGFSYLGPVAKDAVGEFNGGLDVVLTPVPDGVMVTGSKVFEALAIGIPVVCIQSAGGGARALLEGHPHAFGADPDSQAVAAALVQAAEAARSMTSDEPETIRASMRPLERLRSLRPLLDAVTASTESQTIIR